MLRIKAAHDQRVEWKTTAQLAREFFSDLHNYVQLMPGVEAITNDGTGVACWLIRADVPVIGSTRQAFHVHQTMDTPARIEWSPATTEEKNFMRYSAEFDPRDDETTLIRVAQRVELRRASASKLHPLAGIAGEECLSTALQKVLTSMLEAFLKGARTHLEFRSPNR